MRKKPPPSPTNLASQALSIHKLTKLPPPTSRSTANEASETVHSLNTSLLWWRVTHTRSLRWRFWRGFGSEKVDRQWVMVLEEENSLGRCVVGSAWLTRATPPVLMGSRSDSLCFPCFFFFVCVHGVEAVECIGVLWFKSKSRFLEFYINFKKMHLYNGMNTQMHIRIRTWLLYAQ